MGARLAAQAPAIAVAVVDGIGEDGAAPGAGAGTAAASAGAPKRAYNCSVCGQPKSSGSHSECKDALAAKKAAREAKRVKLVAGPENLSHQGDVEAHTGAGASILV